MAITPEAIREILIQARAICVEGQPKVQTWVVYMEKKVVNKVLDRVRERTSLPVDIYPQADPWEGHDDF